MSKMKQITTRPMCK